jgi:hypothetical protein
VGEIIRTLSDSDKPLCPAVAQMPPSEAHMLRNRMLDAFYEKAERNTDGEFASTEVESAYYAAAYGPQVSERMDLFRESVSFLEHGTYAVVESFYFRCRVCGLILPAQRRGDTRA